jgi:hypothetical protein
MTEYDRGLGWVADGLGEDFRSVLGSESACVKLEKAGHDRSWMSEKGRADRCMQRSFSTSTRMYPSNARVECRHLCQELPRSQRSTASASKTDLDGTRRSLAGIRTLSNILAWRCNLAKS